MKTVIANSKAEREKISSLLTKKVPSYRQAYSDRTSWIMACLSELAYIRFNPLFPDDKLKQYFLTKISGLIDSGRQTKLASLIDAVAYDHKKEEALLKTELTTLNFELVRSFDQDGTQAIIVSSNEFIVLSFRGTEAASIKDIRADAKAKTTKGHSEGRMHSGFKEAFDVVVRDVEIFLESATELHDKPLFITGHSLGGALATIAAKQISHKGGIAACYTFGAPRVGDEEWISTIKTPIYRLVNAADCVPMLPPGTELITAVSWLVQFIPTVGGTLRKMLLSKFGGYLHGGNMRYLTNCVKGDYEPVRLLYSVSFFYRIKGYFYKKLPFRAFLADHSISIYRKKLEVIAIRRNP